MPSQFFDESGRPVRTGGARQGSYLGLPERPRFDIRRRSWPTMPKVVHVVLSLDFGGMERVVLELVREGFRRGQQPAVICLVKKGTLAPRVKSLGAEVVCLHKRDGLRFATIGRVRKALRHLMPDVVHTHQIGALLYAGPAARRERAPAVIHTEHIDHVAKAVGAPKKLRVRGLWTVAGRYADRFACVSHDIAESVARNSIVSRRKIMVVPNGVDTEAFIDASGAEALRQSLGIPHDAAVIGSIGRLNEVKRQDLLIRAFARLVGGQLSVVRGQLFDNGPHDPKPARPHPCPLSEGEGAGGNPSSLISHRSPRPGLSPDACRLTPYLLLVGDGPEMETLKQLAAELGVAHCVHFAGYQARPQDYLHVMDVFALTSRAEGMPLVILEAWAAGKPVVCSRVGGIPKLIDDGRTGLLFDSGDEAALTDCLRRLFTDPALARQMGEAGRAHARAEFDTRTMAARYEGVYREVYERESAIEQR